MIKQAHLRVGVYWHIFPTYGEAKDSIWRDPAMLFNIIPNELVDKRNESELVVYFKNGSIYQLKGSDQPDALRGPNPFGVVFDEFDTQKMDGWVVVEPVLRANGGWAWFVGTPRGKGKLYDFYHRGQSGHKEWWSSLLKASESGIIAPDQLVEARKSMTESLYSQEFECAFLESAGSVFRGVSQVMIEDPQKPLQGRMYVMGVDLAKVQDFTVIRIYDRETNSLVYSDRFQNLEWPYQKKKIATYSKYYNDALVVIDATGLGDPVADDLTRARVPVMPFKITMQSKKDIIEKLSLWIEQKKIKLLKEKYNQTEALLEYENFSYDIGPTGNIRYGAREGWHDDVVIADALAVWYMSPVFIPEFTKELSPLQIKLRRDIAKYESAQEGEISEDGDFQYNPDYSEWGYDTNDTEYGGDL